MGYLEQKQKLESLHYFIKSQSAVNVKALTNKLDVSRRTVLRMVEVLRNTGVDIKFCKKRKVYFIEE